MDSIEYDLYVRKRVDTLQI